MSGLLESLIAAAESAPPHASDATAPALADDARGLPAWRAQALRAARAAGLPAARNEAWKYTSLRALERRTFASPSAAAPEGVALPDGPRLVFVNGRFDAAHSRLEVGAGVVLQTMSRALAAGDSGAFEAFESHDAAARAVGALSGASPDAAAAGAGAASVFTMLNAGLAGDGVHLRVAAGVDAGTVHLVFIGAPAPDAAWHLRHLVELGEGARLVLCEQRLAAGPHAHLANEVAHIGLARRAVLRHARVQHDAEAATAFLRTDAVLADEAHYRRVDLELGAGLSRHELNVALRGERATLHANGVLLAGGRRHLDTRLGIDHAARDTCSQLTWRAIGHGRGRAVFHGGILIREGADGSEANLANKNLLLSEGAEIDTQPVLEIHADEVKAAHGATVGQLNETAMFYLRSRGIPEPQARAMLTAAFVREVLNVVDDPATLERLAARVQSALDALA